MGAGPDFIREIKLGPEWLQHIRKGPLRYIADASNISIQTTRHTDLIVRLGPRLVKLEFIVCS